MSVVRDSRLKAIRLCSALVASLLFPALGCEDSQDVALPEAEIGIFYGGQVQRLKSFELSTVQPPKFGFRVTFPASGTEPASPVRRVRYEVVRPGPAGRRVTKEGELELPPGQRQLDHLVELPDHARPGIWNVRVVAEGAILADRALNLEAPR